MRRFARALHQSGPEQVSFYARRVRLDSEKQKKKCFYTSFFERKSRGEETWRLPKRHAAKQSAHTSCTECVDEVPTHPQLAVWNAEGPSVPELRMALNLAYSLHRRTFDARTLDPQGWVGG